ncbi:coiled-coil domain-containing protein 39 isoform X2 [Drosophila takahashii]|uniref:coiled-coil domain-containing protein 39 isoform X2 n=1 Tax=Drosophila takahashii TaxID=29030 RepID=UPI0038992133
MVKRYKGSRSMTASDGVSASSKDSDQVYCVLLHVVEAINFVGRDAAEREQIVMNAALNTVDFEVEGTQSTEKVIFNSNCIWECDMAGIKRIKTDHRPVKLTFYACRGGGADRKTVGSLLLPIRGLPVLSTTGSQNSPHLKMLWHKLICISSEFRSHKPEVLLMLAIVKKSILHTKDFDHLMQFTEVKSPPTPPMQSPGHSITASMLQSQANVYVQSLVQLGLLQVGNDPLVDCDIIEVVLQLKELKNVSRLVKSVSQGREPPGSVILVFDFVGNVTNIELKLNESDSYTLNDVLGLRFKTSLASMRLYFQRIFYLPINMYMNGTAIANYRMDFANLLPPDNYFAEHQKYTFNGSFSFNRFGRTDSGREPKPPLMEYTFSVDLKTIFSRQGQEDTEPTPSVASGVIREPKDRNDHKELEVISVSKKTASVGSLNVGAELSGSEGSYRSSPPEDIHDSDGPTDLRKPQIRRNKFTRLNSGEGNLESEDEQYLGQTFSATVVREDLNLIKCEEVSVSKSRKTETMSDESEAEVASKKVCKVVEEIEKSTAQELPKYYAPLPNKAKPKSLGPKELIRESSQLKMQGLKNPSTLLQENDSENCEELNSLDLFELEEKSQAKEAELESLRRQRIKAGRGELLQVPMDRKIRKTRKVDNEVLGKESSVNIIEEDIPKSPSKFISGDKESASKLRNQRLYKKQHKDNGFVEDSYEKSEEDPSCHVLPDNPNSPREKLNKKPRGTRTVKAPECMDTDLETDISVLSLRSKCKTKSKLLLPEEFEDFEETSTSTQGSRRPKTSKESLNLRARWVEVNKVQSQALGETEKFLQETCPAELDEVLYEDQLSLGLAKPPKPKKKLGKAKEEKVKSIDYESSYVEEITFSQSEENLPVHQVELASSEEYISLSEGNSRSAEMISSEAEHRDVRVTFAQSKVVKKKLRASSGEDQVNQVKLRTSEECVSMTDRVKKKMRAPVYEDQVEFNSSQEFISMSEGNVKSAEIINEDIEQRNVRILKKKKLKKTLVSEDPVIHDSEIPEEESVKPVKKKIVRKKITVISENSELTGNINTQEVVNAQPKKIVRKKSKPVSDNRTAEECPKTIKVASSRKELKNVTTSEEDFSMEHPKNTIDSIGQRIKSWRRQQTDIFEQELARKELHYKKQLEEMENQEARIHQLSKEEASPDETFISNRTNVTSVDYEAKFKELEEHIYLLKSEMEEQVRLFENRSGELRQENLQLYTEKTELKVRLAAMEQQIGDLRAQGSDEGDLKQVLGELRSQHFRYNNLAREKELYRKRWRRSAKRVHALKLAMYERNLEREQNSIKVEPIDLRQILTKDALEFEREYGQFRENGVSPRYPFGSLSGSGDFSPPNKKRMPANEF